MTEVESFAALMQSFLLEDFMEFDISKFFDESNNFIAQALANKGRVLVHCAMGVSRSATLVIAFIMFHMQLSFTRADRIIRKKHKEARPNFGFVTQLQAYDKLLRPRSELCCSLV